MTSAVYGRVLEVFVRPGQTVGDGDEMVIIESMKVQNVMTADASYVVDSVLVVAQEAVRPGQVLLSLTVAAT